MSLTREQSRLAHIAFNRFGLGAKPGGMDRIGSDAKAALMAELNTPGIAYIQNGKLATYDEACAVVHTDFAAEDGMKERELTARLNAHMKPEIGFVERLVLFFSNHFSMSVNKDGAIRATIGQLERNVIRRQVLGSFKAMLIGVMKHPAMLCFLDNDSSIGPNSVSGRSWGVGLNHNLAREILELHTMGVGGGYTEDDIKGLARIISGWSFVRGWESDGRYNGGNLRNRGQFIYRPDWHEPGQHVVLGQSYAGSGLRQGEEVFADLAVHPSTAQYIAFKLIRHFITDTPTPAMVRPLTLAYRRSRGNLKAVAEALINLPEAWSEPLQKLRTPYELQVAEMRALDRVYEQRSRWPFSEALGALRHKPWERPAPDGYTEDSAYWMGPDAMRIRMETAQLHTWALLNIKPFSRTALQLAGSLFGGAMSRVSREAIAETPNLHNGLALLFMTPEFQRR